MAEETTVICVFSNKGGSGKTTVAVHLALFWARNTPTVLLDADPQGTASEWLKRRPGDLKSPVTVACAGREALERALRLARAESFRYVIIDLPPHSTAQIAWLLQEADLILVPTRPTAADLVTIQQTVDLVHASKRRAGFILSAFRPQLVEAKEIAPILSKHGLPIIGYLGDRIAYSRGLPAGLGGHELGDEQAADEVSKLARKVIQARMEL